MLYVVSYALHPTRLNPQLVQALMKSANWMHYIDNTWIVGTNEDADQLSSRLKPFIRDSDWLLIVEIKHSSRYQGWLPKEAWDWLEDARDKGWMTY